ncbi:prion-inhibition and propagation-domain-containing protein [Staphylotrichum tortipilum]|uniref:Prion-inhibition and propagation-domain-containing protein n=1 Tax=Staphylotrichum tortipilum TaxID=2831512 RepID=A0AAN6MLI3_9PEZI|nr:prion-inhibition and propagation-domain-containing protein [Staphylotrichum longicolle]
MDPLSVAGLAIGVVGLTFQLFSGCVTAYQLLLDANDMPERYQYLWVRLQMEQHKLLDWARIANLSEDDATLSSGLRLSRHLINDALHQIEVLLLDLSGLRTRYKLTLVAEGPGAAGKGHTETAAAIAETAPSSGREIKAKALDLIAKSRRYPTRLRWAAFDADKFASLLADLTALNDNMMYFLETDQKRVAFQLQQASFMRILQVSDKVDELIDLVSSLEVAGKGARIQGPSAVPGDTSSSDPASSARQTQEQRLVRLARFKALSVVVEGQNSADPRATSLRQSTTSNLEIDTAGLVGLDAEDDSTTESRGWYTYRGGGVWVEWKTYIGQGLDSLPPSYVEDRVRKLAALLHNDQKPSEFRVPDCLGYVHQPELERFGYVFRWPDITTPTTPSHPPTSLHTLLHTLPCMPPLGTRIAIMRTIATSIWYLHATNWLHKGLRSDNVLFHLPPSTPSPMAQTTPYLSGFEYARPSSASERTEKPLARHLPHELYRHPRVQFDLPRESTIIFSNPSGQQQGKRRGFRKRHDLYALGVVLLEVALWEPVYKLLGLEGEGEVTPRVVRGAWEALAEVRGYEGRLRGMVGDGVAEAVVVCIGGRLVAGKEGGEEDGGDEVLLQAALGERVVGVLEGVVV